AVTLGGGSITIGASGTVSYNLGSNGQNVAPGTYGNLIFSGFNETWSPTGTIGIGGTFTPGAATGHTITGSTVSFNSASAQTIPAINYNNLTSTSTGGRTLASSGTIGIAGTFTAGTNVYTTTGSTLDYNGSSAQTMPSSGVTTSIERANV